VPADDRQPEPWESGAAAPFLWVGEVVVWALGHRRYRVVAPTAEEMVDGGCGRARRPYINSWARRKPARPPGGLAL
jgi:hypothetical protein